MLGLDYTLHALDQVDVSFPLPNLMELKSVIDKTKSWNEFLELQLESGMFIIHCHAPHKSIQIKMNVQLKRDLESCLVIETKHFLCFLESYGMHPSHVTCHVKMNQWYTSLHVYFILYKN